MKTTVAVVGSGGSVRVTVSNSTSPSERSVNRQLAGMESSFLDQLGKKFLHSLVLVLHKLVTVTVTVTGNSNTNKFIQY